MRNFNLCVLILFFSQTGFTKGRNDSHTFAIIADAGKWTKNTELCLNSIKKSGVQKLILPGDNEYGVEYDQAWKPWSDAGFTFNVVAIGNHTHGYDKEVKYFSMPAEYYSKVENGIYRFIVLNSDNEDNVDAQMIFLENELNQAKEPNVFLVYHHPSVTVSDKHDWKEKKEFQIKLRALVFKYRSKISALLLGHDHIIGLYHLNDLPAIVSGATYELRDHLPVNNVQEGINVKTNWMYQGKDDPHWAQLTVNSALSKFKFVNSKNQVVPCEFSVKTGKPAQITSGCKINNSLKTVKMITN